MNPNFQFHPASAGIGCADAIDFGNDMKRFWLGKAGHTAASHADAWTVAMLWQSPWLRSSFGLLWGPQHSQGPRLAATSVWGMQCWRVPGNA